MGLTALKRYGFDGVGEDSGAKKRYRMRENTKQDDAAMSIPATVGVHKKCGLAGEGTEKEGARKSGFASYVCNCPLGYLSQGI